MILRNSRNVLNFLALILQLYFLFFFFHYLLFDRVSGLSSSLCSFLSFLKAKSISNEFLERFISGSQNFLLFSGTFSAFSISLLLNMFLADLRYNDVKFPFTSSPVLSGLISCQGVHSANQRTIRNFFPVCYTSQK